MINFKMAHYLEKAMYCEAPRNEDLDLIYLHLSNYLKSKNLDRKKCLKGDVRLDASDFMQKVQNYMV